MVFLVAHRRGVVAGRPIGADLQDGRAARALGRAVAGPSPGPAGEAAHRAMLALLEDVSFRYLAGGLGIPIPVGTVLRADPLPPESRRDILDTPTGLVG